MKSLSWITVPVTLPLVVASAHASIIRDSTGYPDNPSWVNGGYVMNSNINGSNYVVTGFRGMNLPQATSIEDVSGVMASSNASFNWSTNIQSIRINVFSSPQAFAANPLLGDVYTTTGVSIENLAGTAPPAWGGVNVGGWTNRWVDLGFNPFTLQSGDYITSVLFSVNLGFLAWTETRHDYGLPGDISANGLNPGSYFEYASQSGFTTGDAAVRISGSAVPGPGSIALLAGTGITAVRRRRR